MTAAPDTRRHTPLAAQLAREITATGPIGIDTYIGRCLGDASHGYYTTRSGIGRDGDFTTAPEISQVFGELIGLWAAVVWQQMGAPPRLNLVELGPGRGQLMADALRAARILPGFLGALDVHLCEINPTFRAQQREKLEGLGLGRAPTWHVDWPADPAALAEQATIVIGNEFLDTIPGGQWQQRADGTWLERCVGLDADGQLTFVTRDGRGPPGHTDADLPPSPDADAIYTHTDFRPWVGRLAARAGASPFAALFIDYGHTTTAWGDTLQAVRAHQVEHPLSSPGEADLSLAVDFAAVQRALRAAGLASDGPLSQAEFLGQLGIAERASKLMTANPARANDIEAAVFRLMAAPGMGTRFHAITARSPDLAPLPGFASAGS